MSGPVAWPASASTAAPRARYAAPVLRHGAVLQPAFDEDGLTLLWDAARDAGLGEGAGVAVSGVVPPDWWWKATAFRQDPAGTTLRLAETRWGPVVMAGPGNPDLAAQQAWSRARSLDTAESARLLRLRDGPGGEEESPLGAFVTQARHNDVLASRLRLGPGRVEAATRVSAGAAPSEFIPFQEAVGEYHVVLVRLASGAATVGMWAAAEPPVVGQSVRPTLRRLFRQQGAWRYGAKFIPA